MRIREAQLDDEVSMAKIHIDTWRTTYRGILPDKYLAQLSYQKRQQGWQQLLSEAPAKGQSIYVVETDSGQMIGFANGGPERTENPMYKGELYAIYILNSHQRQGIGRQLVCRIAEQLAHAGINSMLVWVLADNLACRFYEALGGCKIDEQWIERGESQLKEVAYGWTDVNALTRNTC